MARFDIHVQSRPPAEQRSSDKIFTFGYKDTLGVKGFQMLINMWMKIFFTRRGSDPTNLERGTPFPNLIGSTVSLQDAEDITRQSIDICNAQVWDIQSARTDLDPRERLAEARLLRYVPDASKPGFDAYVEIMNVAGERLQVSLPDVLNGG